MARHATLLALAARPAVPGGLVVNVAEDGAFFRGRALLRRRIQPDQR